jgi:CHAD domain-containing protein
VKTAVFAPGRVGALPAYLGYLFLRFPGTLGPETVRSLVCLDTYDRRWTRARQVWVREGETQTLVTPPSLLATGTASFGLQKPIALGRVTLRVRQVTFDAEQGFVEGQLVKFRNQTWLVLHGRDEAYDALVTALTTEGLRPLEPGEGWWVSDKGPAFVPPADWPPLGPEDAAAPALADRLKDGLRVLRQYERGVRDDVDTECLHQFRVHLRRVRSLISLGQLWEGVPEWDQAKEQLRVLQDKTNDLRDLDVLLIDLPDLRAQVPWGEGAHLSAWETTVIARRRAEWRKVRTWMESEEYTVLVTGIAQLFDALTIMGAPWTAAELAQRAFDRAARSVQKVLKRLPADPPDEALHEVRIRTKKLRYVLDGLGSLGPAGAVKTLMTALRSTQEALGKFQDRSVLLARLKSGLAGARSGKTDPLAYGLLVGVIAGEHARLKADARRDAKTLSSKEVLRALERLSPPPPKPEAPNGE